MSKLVLAIIAFLAFLICTFIIYNDPNFKIGLVFCGVFMGLTLAQIMRLPMGKK